MSYQHNFLTQVIARMDFDRDLNLQAEGPSKAIVDTIKKRFPWTEITENTRREVTISPKDVGDRTVRLKEWSYHSRDRQNRILLAENCTFLEIKNYQSFDSLLEDFLPYSKAIFSLYAALQIKRLGLRYINEITDNAGRSPTQWSGLIDQRLLESLGMVTDHATLSRAMGVMEFNYSSEENEMYMRFQYGMPNPDHPTPIKTPHYVLDYDAFMPQILDGSEVETCLRNLHKKIEESFEESIGNSMRDILGAIA